MLAAVCAQYPFRTGYGSMFGVRGGARLPPARRPDLGGDGRPSVVRRCISAAECEGAGGDFCQPKPLIYLPYAFRGRRIEMKRARMCVQAIVIGATCHRCHVSVAVFLCVLWAVFGSDSTSSVIDNMSGEYRSGAPAFFLPINASKIIITRGRKAFQFLAAARRRKAKPPVPRRTPSPT